MWSFSYFYRLEIHWIHLIRCRENTPDLCSSTNYQDSVGFEPLTSTNLRSAVRSANQCTLPRQLVGRGFEHRPRLSGTPCRNFNNFDDTNAWGYHLISDNSFNVYESKWLFCQFLSGTEEISNIWFNNMWIFLKEIARSARWDFSKYIVHLWLWIFRAEMFRYFETVDDIY